MSKPGKHLSRGSVEAVLSYRPSPSYDYSLLVQKLAFWLSISLLLLSPLSRQNPQANYHKQPTPQGRTLRDAPRIELMRIPGQEPIHY
ncbi:hypothetical protein GJ744_001876 [Endocarpon pusillum]|uniref:Uncharacterized protein n=1 Tax=Endocarpon pusillum TaxID=364733 RepID=A0A8H7E8N1_9EURO|nr:hypothetical protein GJ744_001876 [Endocarpon pusillum]